MYSRLSTIHIRSSSSKIANFFFPVSMTHYCQHLHSPLAPPPQQEDTYISNTCHKQFRNTVTSQHNTAYSLGSAWFYLVQLTLLHSLNPSPPQQQQQQQQSSYSSIGLGKMWPSREVFTTLSHLNSFSNTI